MYVSSWLWFLRILVKFALFGAPAGGILWYWKRRGVRSRKLYYASCANLACYLLWLTVVVTMLVMQTFPALRSMIDYRVPAYVFFYCPFCAMFGSFILCISCVAAVAAEEMKEFVFILLVNGLMLILWLSTVVAPN